MNWKLVQAAIGEPRIDQWDPAPDGEDLTLGFSFMRALAEHDETLIEVAPSVWRHTGSDPGNSGPGRL